MLYIMHDDCFDPNLLKHSIFMLIVKVSQIFKENKKNKHFLILYISLYMSQDMRFPLMWYVRPAKA